LKSPIFEESDFGLPNLSTILRLNSSDFVVNLPWKNEKKGKLFLNASNYLLLAQHSHSIAWLQCRYCL